RVRRKIRIRRRRIQRTILTTSGWWLGSSGTGNVTIADYATVPRPAHRARSTASRARPRRVIELQRLSNRLHRLRGHATFERAPAPEGLRRDQRSRLEIPAALADRRQHALQDGHEAPLHWNVADRSLHVPRLELIDLLRVRIESVVIREHGIAFDVP